MYYISSIRPTIIPVTIMLRYLFIRYHNTRKMITWIKLDGVKACQAKYPDATKIAMFATIKIKATHPSFFIVLKF